MEIDAGYVVSSALRFMDHLPESEAAACFARLSAGLRNSPVDLAGPPALFDQPKVASRA